MAQTPQTGPSTVARGSLRRGPCSHVVVCINLQLEAKGAFRLCENMFFWARKTSGYHSVSIFKFF